SSSTTKIFCFTSAAWHAQIRHTISIRQRTGNKHVTVGLRKHCPSHPNWGAAGRGASLHSRTAEGRSAAKSRQLAWPVLLLKCMHKTYFYIIAFMLPLAAIVAAIICKLKVQVPVGYQDENGFHVGPDRAAGNVNWPPFW